jgi:branched-subunit amino acid transport protein
VLCAIILSDMLQRDEQISLSAANPRLLAGTLAILVAWRTRNIFLTIVAGMLALYLFLFLLG